MENIFMTGRIWNQTLSRIDEAMRKSVSSPTILGFSENSIIRERIWDQIGRHVALKLATEPDGVLNFLSRR